MEDQHYVVKKGDSLWGIAKYYGYTVDELAEHNHLTGKEKNLIHIGQKIYLPSKDAKPASYDLTLRMRIVGLTNKPIKNTNIKVTHDNKTVEARTDSEGWLYGLNIEDHVKGLKVEFETYDRKWKTIFNEKIMPLGKMILHINTLSELIKTNTLRKDGPTLIATKDIGKEIVKRTQQPSPTMPLNKPLANVSGKSVILETRTDGGKPTYVVAAVFASDNLKLHPGNEKFRKVLIEAADRYDLKSHALAAIVEAEARLTKEGGWDEISLPYSEESTSLGLGQFTEGTWFDYLAKPGTLGNIKAIEYLGKPDKLVAKNSNLYRIDKGRENEVDSSSRKYLLELRKDGRYSIDAIGDKMKKGLQFLKNKNIAVSNLPADQQVKIAYIMHHEGNEGGALYLSGQLGRTENSNAKTVKNRLIKQFRTKKNDGKARAEEIANLFGGDYIKAYYYFVANHTDTHVRTKNFMLKQKEFEELSAYEVIRKVSGVTIEIPEAKTPQPKTVTAQQPAKKPSQPVSATTTVKPSQEVGPAQGIGGVVGWSDPLDRCSIRVGGYGSSKNKTNPPNARLQSLFLGRGGKHKGIDLDAVPGTPVKAVANGEIIVTSFSKTYGSLMLLKVNVNDLPPAQKKYAEESLLKLQSTTQTIYFMYAHLSEIGIMLNGKKPTVVTAGQVIGKSGDSGNAKGMNQVNNHPGKPFGAHLHFEVRYSHILTKGMGKWFDPLPFLNLCN